MENEWMERYERHVAHHERENMRKFCDDEGIRPEQIDARAGAKEAYKAEIHYRDFPAMSVERVFCIGTQHGK